eukprot:g2358.t1
MGAKGSAIAKKKNEKSKEWTGSFIRNTRRETEGIVSAVFSDAVAGDRSSQNLMLHDAYQWFVEAANKGDAEAQYQLAWRLTMGWGIGIDIKEARQWYVRAAAQGHKTAKADLETLDEEGEEALYKSKDGMTAAAGHEEKYGDGDPRADILYKQGMECINNELPFMKNLWTPELKQAATLFERAALSGHSEAQYKMGLWLESGCCCIMIKTLIKTIQPA